MGQLYAVIAIAKINLDVLLKLIPSAKKFCEDLMQL